MSFSRETSGKKVTTETGDISAASAVAPGQNKNTLEVYSFSSSFSCSRSEISATPAAIFSLPNFRETSFVSSS